MDGYSPDEKIFNLQLIIQKLEEELLLYRNGTTATELLELIHEKDVEIETWRAKCEEKDEKLKRLAKTSGDVLLNYERLQDDLQHKDNEKYRLEDICKRMQEEKQSLDVQYNELKQELQSLGELLKSKDDSIGTLRLEVWEQKQMITKFEEMKLTFESQMEEMSNEKVSLKEIESERIVALEASLAEAQGAVVRKDQEIQDIKVDITKWKGYVEEQDRSIEKLQKRCATLVAEKSEKLRALDIERQEMINHVQQFRESMANNLSQRDEMIRKKDDKIRELNLQITILKGQKNSSTQESNKEDSSNGRSALSERTNLIAPLTSENLTKLSKQTSKDKKKVVDAAENNNSGSSAENTVTNALAAAVL